MRTIAGITMGQAPRTDMTDDLKARLADGLELVEYGVLDDITPDRVARELAPEPGDEVLVSRMRDGSQVMFSGIKAMPRVQACIDRAEAAGAAASIVLCTGLFPAFRHDRPLVFPQPLFHSVAGSLSGGRPVGVMVPEPEQVEQARSWWAANGIATRIVCASPYEAVDAASGVPAGVISAARELRGSDCAFLALDCMGYSRAMRDAARDASGLDVLLPRTLVASVVSELMG